MKTPVVERFADGQAIITEGVMSTKAFIVISGKVRISKKIKNRSITVGVLKEGDVFGEMGLFQETVRSATATAQGDVTVGVIDKQRFKDMLSKCPEDMQAIIGSALDRLRVTTDRLAALGLQWEKANKALESVSIKEKIS